LLTIPYPVSLSGARSHRSACMTGRLAERRCLFSIVVLLLSIIVPPSTVSPAQAREDPPPAADGSDHARPYQSTIQNGRPLTLRKRTTTDGVLPFDEPVNMKVKGVQLHVPAAYIFPWPHYQVRNKANNWGALDIEFWMPDRRYLEISPLSNVESRPTEPGREKPGPDAYLVRVRDLQPTRLDESGYISPEQKFRNLTSIGSATIESFSFEDEPFGLVRFWQRDWPYPTPPAFITYRHKSGTDPQAIIDCTPPSRPTPQPSCKGNIHFVADELAFLFAFPREELPHWHDIALAVRELYTSWKSSP
jgi:hypothetical protein